MTSLTLRLRSPSRVAIDSSFSPARQAARIASVWASAAMVSFSRLICAGAWLIAFASSFPVVRCAAWSSPPPSDGSQKTRR
jgi:hypothetical protein